MIWQKALIGFEDFKNDKGIVKAVITLLALPVIPVALFYTIYQWFKQRKDWNRRDRITALDFGIDGITLFTPQRSFLLPYADTHLFVTTKIITVRSKNSTRPAIAYVTLLFVHDKKTYSVSHQTSQELLFKLLDLNRYLKQLSFRFDLSSDSDSDQRDLANFLEEQLENQRLFGMHARYYNWIALMAAAIMLVILPLAFLGEVIFSIKLPMSWILDGLLLAMLVGGIVILYNVCKDISIRRKLKRLKQGKL